MECMRQWHAPNTAACAHPINLPAVNSLSSEFLAAKPWLPDSVTKDPLCLMVTTMKRSCALRQGSGSKEGEAASVHAADPRGLTPIAGRATYSPLPPNPLLTLRRSHQRFCCPAPRSRTWGGMLAAPAHSIACPRACTPAGVDRAPGQPARLLRPRTAYQLNRTGTGAERWRKGRVTLHD
eukprot:358851-Chlamydomonas_euryale.AAC.6